MVELQFPQTPQAGTSTELFILFWIIINLIWFAMIFTDLFDRIRVSRWDRVIRSRLAQIEVMINEAKSNSEGYLKDLGINDPASVIRNFSSNFFLIEPVSIEPTDIIKRLGHLIRIRDERIRNFVDSILPSTVDKARRFNVAVVLEINWALNTVFRVLRHLYLFGKKHNYWMLLMQLVMILPIIMKELEALKKAVDPFKLGIPIGDSAGPMVVSMFAPRDKRIPIVEETVYIEKEFEGRKIYLVKAEGPGGTVGRPGEAIEKLVESLNCDVSAIITVDAALKLEGEKSGEVAYGVGAAIGDPGPEKISIERTAAKCGVPLHAVVIKMSSEEAITHMTKEIYDGVAKAYDVVKDIITRSTKPGDKVIVAGIGNTVGVY